MSEVQEEVVQDIEEQQEEVIEEQTEEVEEPAEAEEATQEEEKTEEEPKEEEETEPIRQMRKRLREQNKEIRELRRKVAPVAEDVLPPEPELSDYDWDESQFKKAHKDWVKLSIDLEVKQEKKRQEAEQEEAKFKQKLAAYNEAKTQLPADEIEDAEMFVQDTFSVTQQGVMLKGLKNPAKFVLYLGKNESLADELSKIKDPIDFAFRVAEIERDVIVPTKKQVFSADKPVRSGSAPMKASEQILEDALQKARASGDYTDYRRLLEKHKK